MKPHGLGRGLAFALFAALGSVPWLLLWAPRFGYAAALGVYMLGLTPAALAWHAPSLRRGLGAAALALLVSGPLMLFTPAPATPLLAGLCLLGVGRSGICHPRPLPRALVLELTLGLLSACVALWFYDRSLFGSALAIWAFWLVQSGFSLAPGRSQDEDQTEGDAFDRARAAAERLLSAR